MTVTPHDPSPSRTDSRVDSHQGPQASDRALLSRLRQGDDDAATKVYLRYAHRLRALARKQCGPDLGRRLDADDIVQSVFKTFFRRAAKGNYQVPEGDELWKLFLVIALHKIRKWGAFHRAAKRDVRSVVTLRESEGHDVPETADESLAFLQDAIEEVLGTLPESSRQVVKLRVEGFELQEIAERTGRSKRTVERILQGFRQMLKEEIHDGDDHE